MRKGYAYQHFDREGLRKIWVVLGTVLLLMLMGGLGQPNPLQARQVRVEEVAISLHNKPVTGFKVVLDRSPATISSRIIEHVATFDATDPFQYDQTIIFENIRYRAITAQKRISLYFVLRQVPGSLTEVVYIAMYDYRQAVNSQDFPGLSLKLQADLARIVRRTTGDILKSDALLFDDQTLASLSPPEAPPTDRDLVEHFAEEEVENNGVLLRGDPFASEEATTPKRNESDLLSDSAPNGGPDSDEIRKLKAQIQRMELRQAQLERKVKSLKGEQALVERKNEQLMLKLRDSKTLRDSIVVLNRRVEEMLSQYYVADDFSVSSETALEMQTMSRRVQRLERLWRREKAVSDSLREEIEDYEGMLATVGKGARDRARDVRDLKRELAEMQGKVGSSSGTAADGEVLDSLRQVIDLQNQTQLKLGRDMADLQSQTQRQERGYQDLDRIRKQQGKDLKRLQSENKELRQRVAQLTASAATDNSAPNPLRDSLRLMTSRLSQLDDLQAKVARQDARLETQENDLQQKTQSITQLNAQLGSLQKELQDAQEQRQELESRLGTLRNSNATSSDRITELTQAQEQLKREKEQAEGQLAEAIRAQDGLQSDLATLEDSLQDLRAQEAALSSQFADQTVRLLRLIDSTDALRTDLSTSQTDNVRLKREVADLEFVVDSLARYSIPSDDQGQFIREQWTKLQKWEQELKDRDREVEDKEKLMAQRERYLAQREADIEQREARLTDLQEREKRVEVKEKQLGDPNPNDPGRVNVKLDRIIEFGSLVPVFVTECDLPPAAARQRIEAWFKSRDEKLDQDFPDLLFENAYLSEMGTRPWDIRVRIDASNRGSMVQVSFQAEDKAYFGADGARGDQDTAEQLIESMLRYQP